MGFWEKFKAGFNIGVESKSKHPFSIKNGSTSVFKKSSKWEKKDAKRARKEAKRK